MSGTRARIMEPAWVVAGMIALYSLAMAGWVVMRPVHGATFALVDDLAQGVGPLVATVVCFSGLPGRRGRRTGFWWARLFLGCAVLSDATAALIWTFYEHVLHQQTPFPSLDDAFYLMTYPLLFCAILCLPRSPLPRARQGRFLLDALMIVVAAFTFSWYFVLGPTLFQGHESTLARVVGTAYPAADLVLVVCLLGLWIYARDRSLRQPVLMIALGLGLYVLSDSVFDYQSLHGVYKTGGLIDVGWPLADMLFCLAGFTVWHAPSREISGAQHLDDSMFARLPRWQIFIPYVLVPALAGLVVYTLHVHGDEQYEPGVYAGAGALLALVVGRQLLALIERETLYRRLHDMYAELQAAQERLSHQNRDLAEANRRLEGLATTDPLTDLPNHRYLVGALDREIERCRRYNRTCAVLFLDIDHFKALNDSWGHGAGDAALHEFGTRVRETLRGVDLLGRWGGEEFMVVVPEVDAESALAAAQRVREAVADRPLAVAGGVHVTCSIGLAVYPRHGEGRDALVEAADGAMYAAKSLGRNQVRTPEDVGQIAPLLPAAGGTRADTALAGVVEALAAMVEARDDYTGTHVEEVGRLAMQLAFALGCEASEARMIGWGGRLHDIGKVVVPDAILRKPGSLTEREWALIRRHPSVGADVVSRVPALRPLAGLIRGHHERWQGGGYPDGLSGTQITLGARIVAVADAYKAMTSDRPYRRARSVAEALTELRRCAGDQFDPEVVEALARVVDAGAMADAS